MFSRRVAAALCALAGLAAGPTSSGQAADIYERSYAPRAGSPYDDPRYADIYGQVPASPRYVERYEPPPQAYYPPSYKDAGPPPPAYYPPSYRDTAPPPAHRDRYGYLAPMPGPPPLAYEPHYRSRYGHGPQSCIPRHLIRQGLIRDGWRDFDDLDLRDDVARLSARHPDGRFYRLTVDRCTGEIVNARPLDRHHDSYAGRRGYYRTY